MEEIIYCCFLISFFFFLILKLKSELHIFQLNSYRNIRYWRWHKKNFFSIENNFSNGIMMLSAIFIFLKLYIFSSIILILLFNFFIIKFIRKKYKKKLVFTKRATRLFITQIILSFLYLSFVYTKDLSSLNILYIIIFIIFIFAISIIANIVVSPIEIYINNWYYKDAKKNLKSNPNLLIIGITGSYGKTSTKHFLKRILSEKYNVLITPGSYNTTMGVVRTIREFLNSTHQIFIAEMGAKQIGDIKEICELINPKIGILTAVAEQHLETFKNLKNIQKTKFELVDSISNEGFVVLNDDYELINEKKNKIKNTKSYFYSLKNGFSDYYAKNIFFTKNGTKFEIYEKEKLILNLESKLMGDYNISNILASCVVALKLGVKKENIYYAVKKLESVKHRLEIKKQSNGITIIDDAFNSNPVGAKMALNILKNIDGERKIIVTPGMIELQDKQDFFNQKFGEQISNSCDYVILVGKKQTKYIFKGLEKNAFKKEKIFIAKNLSQASEHLREFAKKGDVILYENDLPDTFEEN